MGRMMSSGNNWRPVAYGCSLHHLQLQPPPPTVAGFVPGDLGLSMSTLAKTAPMRSVHGIQGALHKEVFSHESLDGMLSENGAPPTAHDPRPTTHGPQPTAHDPRRTTHDPRRTTHDARPTTHDARRTTHDARPQMPRPTCVHALTVYFLAGRTEADKYYITTRPFEGRSVAIMNQSNMGIWSV